MAPKRAVRKVRRVAEATPSISLGEISSSSSSETSSSHSVPAALPLCLAPSYQVFFFEAPLSHDHYFGHAGWHGYLEDYNVSFHLGRGLPRTRYDTWEKEIAIHNASHSTFRAIITDTNPILSVGDDQIEKPEFFFGNRLAADDDMVCKEDSNLLGQVDDRFFFLPRMKHMYSLSYFQTLSCGRRLNWDLVEGSDDVPLGSPTCSTIYPTWRVTGLRPGEFHWVNPDQERAVPANIFVRRFIAAGGEFPAHEFRAPGWVYSLDGGWWARLTDFVCNELGSSIALPGLEYAVIATRTGIIQSSYNFFAILEKYNPDSCTFFTPVGELGFALHEMYMVSSLPYGELPYEEFVPGTDELSFLRSVYPDIYNTFWEVMCHFHICAQLSGYRSGGLQHMSWAEYLFQNLHDKNAEITRLPVSSPEVIVARINASKVHLGTVRDDLFPAATNFESFHHQAGTPISDKALLAGFFMIWLKRCVVPSKPIESILVDVVYPAVLLAHGGPLSLLSAMVGSLQHGLRELTSEFLAVREIGSAGDKRLRTPQPRVPVPYTFLMAWLVLHCPSLMTGINEDEDLDIPFLSRLAEAQWTYSYIVSIRQVISEKENYRIFCCSPDFGGTEGQHKPFFDGGPGVYTALPENIFKWLLTIRPGYLVLRLGDRCIIEPYLPSRFALQFGYAQLYVGNPNPKLAIIGNLYEGARAWYYWTAGQSSAVFTLPSRYPRGCTVLGFCDWYREASKIPEYNMYTSCLKDIRAMYESRKDSKLTRLKGIAEFLAYESRALQISEVQDEAEDVMILGDAEVPRRRATGKRALNAEEEARYEKRLRKRPNTRRT